MLTRKGEAAPARTGTASTPKCDPQRSAKKTRGVCDCSLNVDNRRVLASSKRLSRLPGFARDSALCIVALAIATTAYVGCGALADRFPTITTVLGLVVIGLAFGFLLGAES